MSKVILQQKREIHKKNLKYIKEKQFFCDSTRTTTKQQQQQQQLKSHKKRFRNKEK